MAVSDLMGLLLMMQPTAVALVALSPAIPQLFYTKALVVRVIAGEMAICFQPEGIVATGKEELLEIAHVDVGWNFQRWL